MASNEQQVKYEPVAGNEKDVEIAQVNIEQSQSVTSKRKTNRTFLYLAACVGQ